MTAYAARGETVYVHTIMAKSLRPSNPHLKPYVRRKLLHYGRPSQQLLSSCLYLVQKKIQYTTLFYDACIVVFVAASFYCYQQMTSTLQLSVQLIQMMSTLLDFNLPLDKVLSALSSILLMRSVCFSVKPRRRHGYKSTRNSKIASKNPRRDSFCAS